MNIDKKNLNIKYFINIGLKLQNFLTIAMHSKMQWFLLCLLLIARSLAYSQQANIENANTDTSTYAPTDTVVTTQRDTLQSNMAFTVYNGRLMATFCNFHHGQRVLAKEAAIKMQQLIIVIKTVIMI